jgi:hypothetical protein
VGGVLSVLGTILCPMRKPLSVIFALLPLIFVALLAHWSLVILVEYWTQLAVGLTLLSVGIIYWGWKPEVDRWFADKRSPKLDRQPESTLHLQPNLRNKLETLHSKLTDTTIDVPTLAISWFESDIERTGYLKALQDSSPELVASFNEMRKLAMDLMPNENNPITHKEAREQLGDKEYERQAASPSRTVNVSWINVWWNRMRDSPELQASINKVKMEIQDLISKTN